jgi:oligoendopeptidase F
MGHSIYFLRSLRSQCPEYGNPSLFTHEVASITNELLYYNYMIENAASEDERLFYLERQLFTFTSTFFSQMILAEFEDWMHKQVESGCGLNSEELAEKYGEIMNVYRGDAVEQPEYANNAWITIPHFYYNYYVFQYSTAICYAAAICQRITSGEEGAAEAYLEFLNLGSSATPAELLRVAGVDPLQEESYQLAMDFFAGMVDEYELLIAG